MTIWKFLLEVSSVEEIEMPEGAEILSIQNQHGNACLWAVVDENKPKQIRRFMWFGTGHELPEGFKSSFNGQFYTDNEKIISYNYIGTVQFNDLVFHLFEVMA